MCEKLFTEFHYENFNINDSSCSSHPTEIDLCDVKAIVYANPTRTVRKIVTAFNIFHISMENNLSQLGMFSFLIFGCHLNGWGQIFFITFPFTIHCCNVKRMTFFWKWTVTGNKKWIVYDVRKRPWGQSIGPPQITLKMELHPKKIMLFLFRDFKGVIYCKLLP